jgi:hypothetical protein
MPLPVNGAGTPKVRLGTLVTENDGRHVGTIRSREWDNTIVVVWNETKWVSRLAPDDLNIHTEEEES